MRSSAECTLEARAGSGSGARAEKLGAANNSILSIQLVRKKIPMPAFEVRSRQGSLPRRYCWVNSLARTSLDRSVEAPAPGLPRQHVGVVGVEPPSVSPGRQLRCRYGT
ncbi:hypothetical protein GQ85_02360 [Rhodococcus rhodochrous]|nr:hypothetical protein GQ85_02360 [Rhodococcus rhodochrous]